MPGFGTRKDRRVYPKRGELRLIPPEEARSNRAGVGGACTMCGEVTPNYVRDPDTGRVINVCPSCWEAV